MGLFFFFVGCGGNGKETAPDTKTKKQVLKHLVFKGIPIDGTVSEFSEKLLRQGYQLAGKQPNNSENHVVYEGIFAKRDAKIDVFFIPSSTLQFVALPGCKCSVIFDFGGSYDQYTSDYNFFHKLIEDKYKGCFINSLDDDGIARQTMRLDFGEIRLKEEISKNSDHFKLIIEYEDAKNYTNYKAELMKDLL